VKHKIMRINQKLYAVNYHQNLFCINFYINYFFAFSSDFCLSALIQKNKFDLKYYLLAN
jgi:hypothetical protein